jgi:hypothetical protein
MQIPVDELFTHRKLKASPIRVRWSELPIDEWHDLSNAAKRELQTMSRPGMSIVRAGREIDQGWYFFGSKRRENYDAWWRAELEFEPDLDELFGVNTLKQGIRPGRGVVQLLTPHVERTAHELHRRVRAKFAKLNANKMYSRAGRLAESRDVYLEPPKTRPKNVQRLEHVDGSSAFATSKKRWSQGLKYTLRMKTLSDRSVFVPAMQSGKLVVTLNTDHPLVDKTYEQVRARRGAPLADIRTVVELLLLSFARAEISIRGRRERTLAASLRRRWSDILHLFLS